MATVAESAREMGERVDAGILPAPEEALEKIRRAERAISGDEVRWQEALAFYNNDQYVFVNAVDGQLDRLEVREGGTKPRQRMRLQRNRLTMQVVNHASFLCGRPPQYEVTSPNQDPKRARQAQLGELALQAEHERLSLDRQVVELMAYAIVTGAGFSWPYWDREAGDWIGEVEDVALYEGEIKMWKLHQGEVLWEAGTQFEDSPWVAVRKAQPPEQVSKRYGYIGPERLGSDAKAGMWERPGNQRGDLVFVYHYLERPCQEYPRGQWLTIANDQLIRAPTDYPRTTGEPCVHKIPWIPMPHKHRDLGAGEMLVDVQRTWNRTINQIIAWKNLVLVPQMKAPVGSLQTKLTEEAGVVWQYRPIAGKEPEWRDVPEIPTSLFKMLDLCLADFDHILGMEELPAGIESGRGVAAVENRRGRATDLFTNAVARFYSNQGHHLLELIQRHYSNPRLLEVQGRFGVERIPDFVGSQLGEPGHVRVSPASVEPRTKAAMEARMMGYAERGWIQPHQAMAAINGGTASQLIDDFELDVARQHREIDQLLAIGGWKPDPAFLRGTMLYMLSPGADPEQLPPSLMDAIPGLPNAEEQDNHPVHRDVLRQWMKTHEFELQPPLVRQAASNHLRQHEMLEDQEAAKMMMRQQSRANMLGMANAGRDTGIKASPSPASQETLEGAAQQPSGE